MKTPIKLLSAATLALLVAGCATPVKTEVKPGANFSAYKTFALMPLPTESPAGDPGAALRLAQPARDAVVAALTAKGFAEASGETADFSVNLRGKSVPKVEVQELGFTYPVHTRYGRTVTVVRDPYLQVNNYDERTLTVEIFDRRSKEMVWVGWLTHEAHGKVKVERVQEAIHRILQEFPPTDAAAK